MSRQVALFGPDAPLHRRDATDREASVPVRNRPSRNQLVTPNTDEKAIAARSGGPSTMPSRCSSHCALTPAHWAHSGSGHRSTGDAHRHCVDEARAGFHCLRGPYALRRGAAIGSSLLSRTGKARRSGSSARRTRPCRQRRRSCRVPVITLGRPSSQADDQRRDLCDEQLRSTNAASSETSPC
jgi:hypothetical protein